MCYDSYLNGEINTINSYIFSVDFSLHHSFKFQKFRFGEQVKFSTLAIVKEGAVRKDSKDKTIQIFE